MDIDDLGDTDTYQCPECCKCMKCKKSPRVTAISLQEAREQSMIEAGVHVDIVAKKVNVKLPFTANPVLTAKHNAKNNYGQARNVYESQCRKDEITNENMRLVHSNLVDRDYMKKLLDMPPEDQDYIIKALFNHYHPSTVVNKDYSLSTSVRMVIDPTRIGLNQILSKGENRLGQIFYIIIRNRTKPFSWASNIPKRYNELH